MNQNELVARQALEIAELQERCKEFAEAMGRIRMGFYCIGGPLNDNRLEYTTAQIVELHQIATHAEL